MIGDLMSATIGSWWLSSTEALPGEEIRFSKAANRTQSSGRAVGGKLFVTNYRILFLPHLADSATGGQKLLLPLAQVRHIGEQPAGGDRLGGGLRDRLMIVHGGGTELFVVNQLPTVVDTIRQLCPPAGGRQPAPHVPAGPAASPAGYGPLSGHLTGPAMAAPALASGPARRSRRDRWVRIGVIGAVAATVTGYNIYKDVHPDHELKPVSAESQQVDSTCPVDGAETLTMTKNSSAEPAIHIPVLPGWEEHDFRNDPTMNKTVAFPYLRGVIANPDLREDDYTPGIEAILEKDTDLTSSREAIADTVVEGLKTTASSVKLSTETICGTSIYRADFAGIKIDGKVATESGTNLFAVTDVRDGARWVVGVKLATANPDNPDYIAERDALLKGFHVSLP